MARTLFKLILFVACWSGYGGVCFALAEEAASERRPEYKPRQVVRPFRPILNAPFLAADEVADQVRDEELVLGVVVAGEARAYSINMLTGPQREIINDVLGKRPIAATW